MGGFNLWCCFCLIQDDSGGPFEDARTGWLEAIEDWCVPKKGELSFTPPPAPTEDVVTISKEDGEFWSEVVCVGPSWDSFITTRGTVEDKFGTITLADYSIDYGDNADPTLIFHPHCLSFLCRRINASPEEIWGCLYSPGSNHPRCKQTSNGLLDELEYYDISGFHDQYYYYCVHEFTPKKGKGKKGKRRENDDWFNPDSMKELQWLLARPTVFPIVASLATSDAFTTLSSPPTLQAQAPCMKIFNVPELLDIVLDYIIGQDIPQAELAKELQSDDVCTPGSIIQTTTAVFALLQVNKSLYTSILRDRQTIFLRLAWMHGWMLPFTPDDWNNWPSENGTFHNGTMFKAKEDQDWRAYLLTFLRKENVHVRNRWRFHRMAVQFARGRSGTKSRRRSGVGELGSRSEVEPELEPWFWEKEEIEAAEDRKGADKKVRKGKGTKTTATKTTARKTKPPV